jgi:2,4-dienoyl-CoA reductase-like NADH-dependent reductase (Old Yellow Enzyme family)
MPMDTDILFRPLDLRNLRLPNRIVRSATYEGLGSPDGTPRPELGDRYRELAEGGAGTIVTGFAFVSREGRAMQPGQCGIDDDAAVRPWRAVVERARAGAPDVRLLLQLAHAGRQTRRESTGLPVVGASSRRCTYFRQSVRPLDADGIRGVVRAFAAAARRARDAGFDGVQVHAAHGYLVHQFLSPETNTRTDRWADRPRLLEEIVVAIRAACGARFPVLVKLSAAEDATPGLRTGNAVETARRLAVVEVDAVEISTGSMEHALNIIRGRWPIDEALAVNPLFRRLPPLVGPLWKAFYLKRYRARLIPFAEDYNVDAAAEIRRAAGLPVIVVGGIRRAGNMVRCIAEKGLDAVALCRPLLREPDLPRRIREGTARASRCSSCNLCTVRCDAPHPVRCWAEAPESAR